MPVRANAGDVLQNEAKSVPWIGEGQAAEKREVRKFGESVRAGIDGGLTKLLNFSIEE